MRLIKLAEVFRLLDLCVANVIELTKIIKNKLFSWHHSALIFMFGTNMNDPRTDTDRVIDKNNRERSSSILMICLVQYGMVFSSYPKNFHYSSMSNLH